MRGLQRGKKRALHNLLNNGGSQSFHQLRFRLILTACYTEMRRLKRPPLYVLTPLVCFLCASEKAGLK